MSDVPTKFVNTDRGSVKAGPEKWVCGCGASVLWDREKASNGIVPNGWVQMKLWIGGAGEFGLTRMDEKILCPSCAWEKGVWEKPTVPEPKKPFELPPGPLKMLPPKRI